MAGRGASSLWMGDIDQYMDERVIAEAFSMMGEHVMSIKLLKDHKTGQNRNYCFVELTSKEAVALALRKLTGLPLPNYPAKRFKLNYSLRDQNPAFQQPGGQGTPGPSSQFPFSKEYSIYVGGLNTSTTDDELLALFAHYKSIKEAKIVRDEGQRSKGFGFVRFFNEMDQEAAIMQMNGAVGPMGVTLKVDKAMPKREVNVSPASGPMPMSTGAAVAALASQYQNAQYPYQSGVDPYAAYPQMAQQQQQQHQHQPAYQPHQPPVQAPVQAPHATPAPPTPQPAQPPAATKNEDDDEVLEDHSAPVNMVATNLAYIQANQDFYKKLAESRWHPVTSYTATLEEVCK